MLKYGMPDLRAFFDADVRWLCALRLPPARHADAVRRVELVNRMADRYADAATPSLGRWRMSASACMSEWLPLRRRCASRAARRTGCSVSYCHCSDCRRARTGAPVAAFVGLVAPMRVEPSPAMTLQTVRERRGDRAASAAFAASPIAYMRPASGEARAYLHARRHGPRPRTIRRRCTPMCASSCPSCTCRTGCRAIRRPASRDQTEIDP